MATKAKTSGTPAAAPAAVQTPEALLNDALALFQAGKADKAMEAFQRLQALAQEGGLFGIERTAMVHMKALEQRLRSEKNFPAQPELDAQILLNREEPEEAVALLDKAIAGNGERAILHYLKSVALAQLHQAEPSAQALTKAAELDPGMLYLFHLESDFDSLRHQSVFARFERH